MKIAIGNDHAGTEYKYAVVDMLKDMGIEVMNCGTDVSDSVDYPDFVHPVATAVDKGEVDFGILICGSGNGVAMTANKHPNVRAALCWMNELVELARSHNNANILCLPARFTAKEQVLDMVKTFLNTEFEGGRHQRRVDKIPFGC